MTGTAAGWAATWDNGAVVDVSDAKLEDFAHEVRRVCLAVVLQAYEEGGFRGLCEEGRLELVADRLRSLDVRGLAGTWAESQLKGDASREGGDS